MRGKPALHAISVLASLTFVLGIAAAEPDPALNNPDKQNWDLFLQVTATVARPRTVTPIIPSPKPLLLFETWASDTDTFQAKPHWPQPNEPREKSLRPRALFLTHLATAARLHSQAVPAPSDSGGTINCPVPADAPAASQNFCQAADALVEDVFRNRAAFDFIVSNDLFEVPGLAAAYAKVAASEKDIAFPVDAIEVKSNWLPLEQLQNYLGPNVKARPESYHQRVIDTASGGHGRTYVLLSMHIMSKLVPNWTWATFEHEDNPGRCNIVGCRDSFGAKQPVTPAVSSSDPDQTHYAACGKSDALKKMFDRGEHDPAFANYCLKGSMTDFADPSGRAFVVGNSVTEQGFVSSSSCMGCHGTAATNNVGGDPNLSNPKFGFIPSTLTNTAPPIGPIDPTLFWTNAPAGGNNTLPMVANQNEDRFPANPEPSGDVENVPLSPLKRIEIPLDFVWSIPFCAYDPQTNKAPCKGK